MSGPTLAGAAVTRATLRIPRYGVWSALVTLADSPALVVGQRVDLVVGNLTMRGTLRPGGDFGGTAHYAVVGGAGRWESAVVPRGDRDDGGVMLSRAAADLARAAGEPAPVLEVPDRSLGYAWTRPAGLASDALRALVGEAWWVAPDGAAHLGPRGPRAVSLPSLTVQRYHVDTLRAQVSLADDALSALLPGAILTAPGLPGPLAIASLTAEVSEGGIRCDLYGERGVPELLVAIVAALTQGTRYHAALPCSTREATVGRASVEPSDVRADGYELPRWLDLVFGLPGASATLAPGSDVIASFLAGDPGSPVVSGYRGGALPAKVGLDATGEIRLGGLGAKKLVQLDELNSILGVIGTRLAALDHAGPLAAASGTTKVRGE